MEFETYSDVIDAFERDNMGYDTLTDYIKGENIKIKEIDMTPLDDLKNTMGSRDQDSGIMATDDAEMMMAEADMQMAEDTQLIVGHLCMQWLNTHKPDLYTTQQNG